MVRKIYVETGKTRVLMTGKIEVRSTLADLRHARQMMAGTKASVK